MCHAGHAQMSFFILSTSHLVESGAIRIYCKLLANYAMQTLVKFSYCISNNLKQ